MFYFQLGGGFQQTPSFREYHACAAAQIYDRERRKVDRTNDLNLAPFVPPRNRICRRGMPGASRLVYPDWQIVSFLAFLSFFLSLFRSLDVYGASSLRTLPARVSFLRVTLESPPNKLHRIRTSSRRTAQQWTQD